MLRFWDTAAVAPTEGGFAVLLDGKPMRIPGGKPLTAAAPALAEAIAAEWQAAGGAKGGAMTMDDVPLTRLAGTAQDRIAPDPAPVVAALARYAESDLLCYRAETPVALVVRQAHAWQPWLDWAARRFGARLEATTGIVHRAQDPAALDAVHQFIPAGNAARDHQGVRAACQRARLLAQRLAHLMHEGGGGGLHGGIADHPRFQILEV